MQLQVSDSKLIWAEGDFNLLCDVAGILWFILFIRNLLHGALRARFCHFFSAAAVKRASQDLRVLCEGRWAAILLAFIQSVTRVIAQNEAGGRLHQRKQDTRDLCAT